MTDPDESPGDPADGDSHSKRTVLIAAETPPSASPPTPDVADAPATVFAPAVGGSWTPSKPAEVSPGQGRLAPGVVLNHIYEVRRFIARGGMGEVYEGVNVNTDERVAIKVILTHLATDPAVQALFRREARTLTRLSHPGLAQYRVLAQEPALDILYIVTEFVDGGQLTDCIGKITPDADELERLLRRLAAGLAAAHELGTIHRDISPDNVLLPGGRLDQAKIIDFGIAKSLDASSKTIVGDGFAGKLGFVAPEQFGDFDRQIGPWTDVYSLGLLILTVAAGRPLDMGSTLVDAIDKRRCGPDLTPLPQRLRPVIERMLAPDPQNRFRSMEEVLDALDASSGAAATATSSAAVERPRRLKLHSSFIAAGVGAIVLLAMIGGVVSMLSNRITAPGKGAAALAGAGGASTAGADTGKIRAALEASLPGQACTWLDVDDVTDGPNGVGVRLSGVAGVPADVQAAIKTAAAGAGLKVDRIDTSNVFPIGQTTCAPLDTLRAFRAPAAQLGRLITSPQATWELTKLNPPCQGPNAKVSVDIQTGAPAQDFTLLGVDRRGGLQQVFADRAALTSFKAQFPNLVSDRGGGGYFTTACQNETGLVGEALVTGAGPFDVDLPNALTSSRSKVVDADWLHRFAAKARAGGWKISMVWYRVVNDEPG